MVGINSTNTIRINTNPNKIFNHRLRFRGLGGGTVDGVSPGPFPGGTFAGFSGLVGSLGSIWLIVGSHNPLCPVLHYRVTRRSPQTTFADFAKRSAWVHRMDYLAIEPMPSPRYADGKLDGPCCRFIMMDSRLRTSLGLGDGFFDANMFDSQRKTWRLIPTRLLFVAAAVSSAGIWSAT
jgi:hypothetical protein